MEDGKIYFPRKGLTGRQYNGTEMSKQEIIDIEKEADRLKESGYTQEKRDNYSAKVYRLLANEIKPRRIKMKQDVHWNHFDGYRPILDKNIRIEESQIIHQHASKEMF